MPVPHEYQRATDAFYAYLTDARDRASVETTHRAFTMTQAVLFAFRRRLTLPQAIRFASALPAVLRAMFVADWDPHEPVAPFVDREALLREVRSLRPEHNFSPDSAIEDVAWALRRHVDPVDWARAMAALPEPARAFWALPNDA